ncbi:MAG: M20/M25/M40 family metallo-hydrolase [Ruthenibacterium lactatiformans]
MKHAPPPVWPNCCAAAGFRRKPVWPARGVKAVLQGGAPGPCAAVIGELDGILCPAHPAANPENGVAHACGHNAQLTALVGAALALSAPGVAEALSGSVAFFAVPAEEYVPIGTRQALQKQGVEFCCGKSELLRTGGFDGVDLALTTHVHMIPCESDLLLGNVACNGFTSKTVVFHGKAAHAPLRPRGRKRPQRGRAGAERRGASAGDFPRMRHGAHPHQHPRGRRGAERGAGDRGNGGHGAGRHTGRWTTRPEIDRACTHAAEAQARTPRF